MPFQEKLPDWHAEGVEPPASKKNTGWDPGERPPAEYWNWQMNRTYKALQELQQKAAEKVEVQQAQQTANEAKATADAAQSDLSAHASATTGVHGATSAATPNTIVQRDPQGRIKAAAPSDPDDVARKAEVDAVQSNLTNHIADYVRQPGYAVATGSANTYAVTLNPAPSGYVDGMAIAVKINVDNTGASTLNVNGLGAKPIKKPNGNDVSAGNLKAGSVYTLRYNGTNFILQGEGGSGNAQPSDVLSGKTFTNDFGEQVGTMPNRTGHVTGQSISRSGTTLRIRPQPGYYPGDSGNSVQYSDPNWVAQNIRQGVSIFGLAGTLEVGIKAAKGNGTTNNGIVTVSSLAFQPRYILATLNSGGNTLYLAVWGDSNHSEFIKYLYRYVVSSDSFSGIASFPWTVTENGFSVSFNGFGNVNGSYSWVAFEEF